MKKDLVCLWLTVGIATISAQFAYAADPEFFYYYRGQQRALNLDSSALAVKLSAHAKNGAKPDEATARAFAAQNSALGYGSEHGKPFRPLGWIKIEVKSAAEKLGPSATQLTPRQKHQKLIEDLTRVEGVQFVTPIFSDSLGDPFNFEPTLLIGFVEGTSDALQDAVLKRIKHVKSIERHGAKNKWTVETGYRSGLDLLDIANEIAALPYVRYAEPSFLVTAEVR